MAIRCDKIRANITGIQKIGTSLTSLDDLRILLPKKLIFYCIIDSKL